MKIILIIIALGGLGYLGWKAIQTKPDANVPQAMVSDTKETTTVTPVPTNPATEIPVVASGKTVDNTNVKISFKGFGPGKLHNGSFSGVSSNLSFNTAQFLTGSITVKVASLTTDTEGVTAHLKTDAFFDVAKYPTAKFVVTNATDTTVKGNFTIHGVTKEVSFPITKSSTDYKTTFNIDMKAFGINQTFANETIELSVVVPLK